VSHPQIHAKSSVRFFGGSLNDYIEIHNWFDQTKAWMPDMRHRAIRHHSEGIFECEKLFGESFLNSDGKTVYTRYVGEQHVIEDLGFIPKASDYLDEMKINDWMMNRDKRIKEFGKGLPLSLRQKIRESQMEDETND
jgi:hypothetical protein